MNETAAATYQFSSSRGCHNAAPVVTTGYTYPGIGVELEQRDDQFVVRRVFKNGPADGKVFPGAVLITADGQRPTSMVGWVGLIRGEAGTPVELEVAYHCRGHEKVTLHRDLINLHY